MIGYISDVEGNLDYFMKYVAISKVLDYDQSQNQLLLRNDCYFVFGGDAVDKGPGDIRFVRLLVDLKDRYPDRVFLILGNRDINKTKLTSEIHQTDIDRSIDEIPGPYWVDSGSRVTYRMFLESLAEEQNVDDINELHNRVNKLKWLLVHTMGCQTTFEFRRQELALLEDCPIDEISDDMVVDSYLYHSCDPSGINYNYLIRANIGVVLGNTLFVHGAITDENAGFVPSNDNLDDRQETVPGEYTDAPVEDWIQSINTFMREQIDNWIQQPQWDDDRSTRGGSALMGYGYASSVGKYTCLVTSFVKDGVFRCPSNRVCNYLYSNNIKRVVVGHKPYGDSPVVLQKNGIEFISCDTSYSDFSKKDNRGSAVSEVRIIGDLFGNYTEIEGILHDKREIFYKINNEQNLGGDPFVGKVIRHEGYDWIIKAKLRDLETWVLTRGEGYKVIYKDVDIDFICSKLFKDPRTKIWGTHFHIYFEEHQLTEAIGVIHALKEFLMEKDVAITRTSTYRSGYGPHKNYNCEIRIETFKQKPGPEIEFVTPDKHFRDIAIGYLWSSINQSEIVISSYPTTHNYLKEDLFVDGIDHRYRGIFLSNKPSEWSPSFFFNPPMVPTRYDKVLMDTRAQTIVEESEIKTIRSKFEIDEQWKIPFGLRSIKLVTDEASILGRGLEHFISNNCKAIVCTFNEVYVTILAQDESDISFEDSGIIMSWIQLNRNYLHPIQLMLGVNSNNGVTNTNAMYCTIPEK
eukprot:TRINITY_DN10602_c0_g1_i1.p1 TRINITY_DN10602_c0_g1~~TRINITY_DN10602_c0_g1_i1.p1  ORF type:complete len:744 (-),score=128.14 TRINITY_DN10602_c0_g1_i1:24-2255(-)